MITFQIDKSPAQVARELDAVDVLKVLQDKKYYVFPNNTIVHVEVMDVADPAFNGKYFRRSAGIIPMGFRKFCEGDESRMPAQKTWDRYNGPKNPWFKVSMWICRFCDSLKTSFQICGNRDVRAVACRPRKLHAFQSS